MGRHSTNGTSNGIDLKNEIHRPGIFIKCMDKAYTYPAIVLCLVKIGWGNMHAHIVMCVCYTHTQWCYTICCQYKTYIVIKVLAVWFFCCCAVWFIFQILNTALTNIAHQEKKTKLIPHNASGRLTCSWPCKPSQHVVGP